MNMISTTAVIAVQAATLSPKSLPNVGEKPNQPKRFSFLKRDYIWQVTRSYHHEECISSAAVVSQLALNPL